MKIKLNKRISSSLASLVLITGCSEEYSKKIPIASPEKNKTYPQVQPYLQIPQTQKYLSTPEKVSSYEIKVPTNTPYLQILENSNF